MSSDLLQDLLKVPTAPAVDKKTDTQFTSKFEISGSEASAELRGEVGTVNESAAYELLRRKGEDPNEWVVTGFRSSEWTMANGELGESNRYTFARKGTRAAELASVDQGAPAPIDELLEIGRASCRERAEVAVGAGRAREKRTVMCG